MSPLHHLKDLLRFPLSVGIRSFFSQPSPVFPPQPPLPKEGPFYHNFPGREPERITGHWSISFRGRTPSAFKCQLFLVLTVNFMIFGNLLLLPQHYALF